MGPTDDAGAAGWRPNPDVLALWPEVSGNAINGLGDTEPGPPRPVFWRTDGSTPHAPVMYYFYDKDKDNEAIAAARTYRQRTAAIPVHDLAAEAERRPPAAWVEAVKDAARAIGADDVGIAAWRPEWAFPDRPTPRGAWAIVMAFAQDYDAMKAAPSDNAYIEVMAQYERAGNTAKHLANWIRDRGHFAAPKTGPMTEDVLMIPAAIEAGLGELGKHGSMIHRRLGANFRLSMVLTELPLEADAPDVFGADAFCRSCQVCANACPPDAIFRDKQMVRGARKWYVDFDKCVPYFVDNKTCGICLAVCPWSRPGVADNLVAKMARRLHAAAAAGAAPA
jgi:epoxyqueuosine reductase